jgi:hypothetical protein
VRLMVDFRGRTGPFEVESSVDMENMEAIIDATLNTVRNSIVSTLASNEVEVYTNFQTESNIEVDPIEGGGYDIAVVQRYSGTIDEHDNEGDERGRLHISVLPEGGRTKVELQDDVMREDKETENKPIGSAGTTKGITKPLEMIRGNPEKVALGYGPPHPLDDIEPTSVDEEIPSMSNTEIVDLFSEWITECIRRTQVAAINDEHGFYVDGANNVVGVVEGTGSRIHYPAHNMSAVRAKFHTHPKFSSAAIPSAPDINSATATQVGTVHMLSITGASTFFYYDEERYREFLDKASPEHDTDPQLKPVKQAPLTAYKVIDADRIGDKETYIDAYVSEMKRILDLNLDMKEDIIDSLGLHGNIEQMLRSNVRETHDDMVERLGDDDDEIIEGISEAIDERGKALQTSRHIVPTMDT